MIEPCCAVCGETKLANLNMFNYGMCLCHRCVEIAAQTFVHDSAERKLEEAERVRKETEADVEAKVRAAIEAKRKASRIAEEAIKFANGTHESLMCNCPGCGKQVPRKDMKRFSRGYYYDVYPVLFCPDCFREKNRAYDLRESERELEKAKRAFHNLKDEYETFRDYARRLWWAVFILGGIVGAFILLMFLNPR